MALNISEMVRDTADIVTMKYQWGLTHALLKVVTANVTESDSEIFNDTKHRAVSLTVESIVFFKR